MGAGVKGQSRGAFTVAREVTFSIGVSSPEKRRASSWHATCSGADAMNRDNMQATLAALLLFAAACSSEVTGDGTPTTERAQALSKAGCTSSVCVRAGTAGCWTNQPLTSACRSCEDTYRQTWAVTAWSGCKAAFDAYGTCLKTSEFTCTDAGVASPTGCDESEAAVEACLKGPGDVVDAGAASAADGGG